MATYTKLARKKGTVYRAQVRVRRQNDGIVHSEAKTFSTKAQAKKWADARERELADPKAVRQTKDGNILLQKVLLDYIDEVGEDFGRTKYLGIKRIASYEVAQTPVGKLTANILLDHLRKRRKHVSPSTADGDLIWIKTVLTHAKLAWGMELDLDFLHSTRTAARQSRLVGKSKQRDRRPTTEELDRLRTWFNRAHVGPAHPITVPMGDVMDFAVASARRLAEITRIQWTDLDTDKGVCLLRDVKAPTGSKGNHRPFALTKEGLAIIERQPRTSKYIFPYQPKTITRYFIRGCQMQNISNLHFHDLRHEATSRLFEAGYQIQEVQQFTLHESWVTLQRYTQLSPEDVANR